MGDWCVLVNVISLKKVCPSPHYPPAPFSQGNARCSLLLKPLKEDSCLTLNFPRESNPGIVSGTFPCVYNLGSRIFVADMWKCSFRHRLFCGMMYELHVNKFGQRTVLLCFLTVAVACDLLELSDKTV